VRVEIAVNRGLSHVVLGFIGVDH